MLCEGEGKRCWYVEVAGSVWVPNWITDVKVTRDQTWLLFLPFGGQQFVHGLS